MSSEEPIWSAAVELAAQVAPGSVVGLGTGRAASQFVRALARRVAEGVPVRGVPTSRETEQLAMELGVPLASLDEVERLQLDVDGADEVDPKLNLIKGHGGALLRERVVASVSERFVILVGEKKLVERLGATREVPVEVVPFAAPVVLRSLADLGARTTIRQRDGVVFESDNGNYILDAQFEDVGDVGQLAGRLDALPGAVDHGLFIGMADAVLVQGESGHRLLEPS